MEFSVAVRSVSYSIQQRPNFFGHLIGNDFNKLLMTFYRAYFPFQNTSLGNMHIFRNIYRHFTQSPNAQIADITLTYLNCNVMQSFKDVAS